MVCLVLSTLQLSCHTLPGIHRVKTCHNLGLPKEHTSCREDLWTFRNIHADLLRAVRCTHHYQVRCVPSLGGDYGTCPFIPEGVYSEGLVPPFPPARDYRFASRDLPIWLRNPRRDFLSNCFCRLHGREQYVLGVCSGRIIFSQKKHCLDRCFVCCWGWQASWRWDALPLAGPS